MAFVVDLLHRTGVLLSPGSGFGAFGAGCVRASLGIDEAELVPAMAACRTADIDWRS